MYVIKRMILASVFLTLSANELFSQIPLPPRDGKRFIGIEVMKPSFAITEEDKFMNSVLYVNGGVPIRENLWLQFDLPFSNAQFSGESEAAIGNPYLGVAFLSGEWASELGVRLPVMSDDKFSAAFNGFMTDWDRLYAFTPDLATVSANFHSHKKYPSNFLIDVSFGPKLTYNTNASVDDKTDLFASFGVHGGFEDEKFGLGVGLTGQTILTEDTDNHTINMADMNLWLNLEKVRPVFFIKVPMDDELDQLLDYTIGARLDFNF